MDFRTPRDPKHRINYARPKSKTNSCFFSITSSWYWSAGAIFRRYSNSLTCTNDYVFSWAENIFCNSLWTKGLASLVRCLWFLIFLLVNNYMIPTLPRNGSPEIPSLLFSNDAKGSFRCMNHMQCTHYSAFDKPVELHWWTCWDKVIGTTVTRNQGSLNKILINIFHQKHF
jgi:hypothetical protein